MQKERSAKLVEKVRLAEYLRTSMSESSATWSKAAVAKLDEFFAAERSFAEIPSLLSTDEQD